MRASLVWIMMLAFLAGLPRGSREAAASADAATAGGAGFSDTLGTAERRALLYGRSEAETTSAGMTPLVRISYPRSTLGEVRGPVRLNTFRRTVVDEATR